MIEKDACTAVHPVKSPWCCLVRDFQRVGHLLWVIIQWQAVWRGFVYSRTCYLQGLCPNPGKSWSTACLTLLGEINVMCSYRSVSVRVFASADCLFGFCTFRDISVVDIMSFVRSSDNHGGPWQLLLAGMTESSSHWDKIWHLPSVTGLCTTSHCHKY